MKIGSCINDACQLNETVTRHNGLMSNSGNYLLRMMENGTLYIVCKGQPIWSTKSSYTDA